MPVETRYMRGDQHTVNALTAYILGLTQSDVSQKCELMGYEPFTGYVGIRVWKRDEAGVETEVTAGKAVAIVSRGTTGSGLQSATWNCPGISMGTTDAIVIRVYHDYTTPPADLCATFITEQLGAEKLEPAVWTVYYYTTWTAIAWPIPAYYHRFFWGTATYNSRVAGFEWTPPVPPVGFGDGLVWVG